MKTIIKTAKLLPWSNPYVTDGLIAMWDGEWNTGIPGKHDPDASTWIDLIGGCTSDKTKDSISWAGKACSLENGYFTVDSLPSAIINAMNADSFTWEVCATYKSGSGQYTGLAASSVRNEFWPATRPGDAYISWHSPSFTCYCSGGDGSMTTTHSFAIDGTQIRGYNKGRHYATNEFVPSGTNESAALRLGSDRGIVADIYSIRMYSRPLDAAEIAANYSADQHRFGIE